MKAAEAREGANDNDERGTSAMMMRAFLNDTLTRCGGPQWAEVPQREWPEGFVPLFTSSRL
jgi:hypothetical protein